MRLIIEYGIPKRTIHDPNQSEHHTIDSRRRRHSSGDWISGIEQENEGIFMNIRAEVPSSIYKLARDWGIDDNEGPRSVILYAELIQLSNVFRGREKWNCPLARSG